MTGYTVHTGASEQFVEGWDRIFGGAKKSSKAKSKAKKSTSSPTTAQKKRATKTRKQSKSAAPSAARKRPKGKK